MEDQYDLIIIGSGPGGYVASIRAGQLGLKTACVEKTRELGGTCLNVGCIPSKSLLHASEFYWRLCKVGKEEGIEAEKLNCNFAQMMKRKEKTVGNFNQGVAALFKKNKVDRYTGTAKLLSPNSIEIDEGTSKKTIQGRNLLLATGSEPIPLPFLPFDEKKVVSSTGALSLKEIPKKMIVIGAGVIGVELGSVYKRLGSEVVFVEFLDRICPVLDAALSKSLQEELTKQGMTFHLTSKVISGGISKDQVILKVEMPDKSTSEMSADVVLVSIGRRPYTAGLGLETAGVKVDQKGFVLIDGAFRTSVPSIYAIGDIVNGPMLAHKASEEGIAAVEIIAGHKPVIDYMAIPSVVYTYPEAAGVGLTEAEAKTFGLEIKTGMFPFKINSRAQCTGEEEGFVKIIAEAKTDQIVGIHIIGPHASELIAQGALAIHKKVTALELANLPFAHPTLAEAIKEAALSVHKRPIHR
ncbi:MAG TPA: dihydrolipoyl dehydrogenase [Rhabdochlamydiaceae bacterium]|nr:dihydrolipoyl dehydrogenase [Rhabdochlamydiaceae bacterium]